MAKIQCKMCGGKLEIDETITCAECPYCGTMSTFPKLSTEKKEQLYNRAEHFRRNNDFDKAITVYETLLNEDTEDPEAYWGIVLSRFGIEYVEDPVSHNRIPTCHRVQFESILSDNDYQQALNYAESYERDLYEEEAQKIANIQKKILVISKQEKPYDVFICYKETTEGGSRTKDSTLAQDIYYQLTSDGYKVFFSRITLEDKLGQEYEPYIFAALNSAKVMLVIGTKQEYFTATWVKNEWSRFLALMKEDHSKMLIPCYQSMDAYDIPDALSMLQSQDMSKIGFIQDLLRGIKKVLHKKELKSENLNNNTIEIDNLLKRIKLFILNEDWEDANNYCEKTLDKSPENAQVYLYKTLIENNINDEAKLYLTTNNFKDSKSFKTALLLANDEYKQYLLSIIEEQNEIIYNKAILKIKKGLYDNALDLFTQIKNYKDANDLIVKCQAEIQREFEENLNNTDSLNFDDYQHQIEQLKQNYYINSKDSIINFEKLLSVLRNEELINEICDFLYKRAVFAMNQGHYTTAINCFQVIESYKNSDALIKKCTDLQLTKPNNNFIIITIIISIIILIFILIFAANYK